MRDDRSLSKVIAWIHLLRLEIVSGPPETRTAAARSLVEWLAASDWDSAFDVGERRRLLDAIDTLGVTARQLPLAPLFDEVLPSDDGRWEECLLELHRARRLAHGIALQLAA